VELYLPLYPENVRRSESKSERPGKVCRVVDAYVVIGPVTFVESLPKPNLKPGLGIGDGFGFRLYMVPALSDYGTRSTEGSSIQKRLLQ